MGRILNWKLFFAGILCCYTTQRKSWDNLDSQMRCWLTKNGKLLEFELGFVFGLCCSVLEFAECVVFQAKACKNWRVELWLWNDEFLLHTFWWWVQCYLTKTNCFWISLVCVQLTTYMVQVKHIFLFLFPHFYQLGFHFVYMLQGFCFVMYSFFFFFHDLFQEQVLIGSFSIVFFFS